MRLKKLFTSLAVLLIIASCEDPRKDVSLHIAPTFYKYVIEVELSDLSDPDQIFSGDVDIAITGEDAASIYNIDGKKQFKPNFGSLQLITTRANEPTPGNPLNFNVEITSTSYRTETIEIEVNEEDYYISTSIDLLNLTNLPTGINSSSATGTLQSNGELSQNLVFKTDSTNGNTSQLKMTVPTGIKFMDANGSVLSGNTLVADVINFSDTSLASQLALPNNTGALQKVRINGNVENIALDPGATFEINMKVDGQEVRQFSGSGIELNIPIPDHMYNYKDDRPYQAGDMVSLISYSKGNTAWEDEGAYTIVMENGKLRIKPSVTHLTTFKVFADLNNINLSKSTITKFVNNTGKTINQNLYLGYEIGSSRFALRFALNMKPGASQEFPFSFNGQLHKLKFYFPEKFPEFDMSIASDKVEITFKEADKSVKVGYKLYCESSNAFVTPPAGVKMYYRKTTEGGKYKHLYTFTGEDLSNNLHTMRQLQAGESYDFRAYFSSHQVDTSNVQVIDNKIYEVNLPDEVCSVIGF